MITERTLKKWRKEALQIKTDTDVILDASQFPVNVSRQSVIEWQIRILRMTQELLDQHLLRKR